MASESKGPDPSTSPYVRLIRCGLFGYFKLQYNGLQSIPFPCSAERHIFILEKKVAMSSGVIKAMLNSDAFIEGSRGEIAFEDISTPVLERVIQYLHYKSKYTNSKVPIPEFPVPPEQALDLLLAANYLDC